MAYSYKERELRQREDDVVSPLDLRRVHSKEAEAGAKEVCQSVLAGLQDALSPSQRLLRGCERFKRGREGMIIPN